MMKASLVLHHTALTEIATNNYIVIEFPTERRLTHDQSELLCDAVESRFAQHGINVRAAGGTNYGDRIAIDVYRKVSK